MSRIQLSSGHSSATARAAAWVRVVVWASAFLATVLPNALADPGDDDLARVVADYTGLYTRDRLTDWRGLFLPGFVAGSTRPDGTVLQRNLDEFYEAQRKYLDTGRAIEETLENVRIERHGPLASVWADFVLEEEGERSRGKLVLTLIAAEGRFRIHSLLFAYDP